MSSGDTNTSNRRERDLSLPVEENGLLEYAKDTISSLLSIYGYEDSISSEVLQELKPKQTETVEKVEVSSTNDPGDNKDITRSSLTGKWFETSSITVNDKVHEGQHSNTKESMMDSDYISNENADFSMSKNTVNDSCLVSSGPGMQQKSITLEDVHHGKYGSSDTQQTVQITSGTLVDVKYYNNQADRLSSCAKVTGDIIDCRDKIINSNQLGKVIEGITVSPIELEIIDGEINPVTGSVEYVQESMTNSSRNTNISTVHAAVGMSYTSIENTGMEGKGIIGSADSNFVTEEREKVIDKGVEVNDKYVDIQSGGDSDDVSYVINIDSDAIKLSESSSEKNAVCNKVERNHVKMVHSGWNEKAEGECMKSEYKRVWVEKGDLESKNQDLLVAEDNQCIKSNDPISKKYVEKTEVMGVLLSNSTQFGKVMDQGNDGISKRNDSRDGQVEVKLSDKAKCLKEGAQGNVVVDDDDDDEVTITCISPPVGKRNEGSSTSFVVQVSKEVAKNSMCCERQKTPRLETTERVESDGDKTLKEELTGGMDDREVATAQSFSGEGKTRQPYLNRRPHLHFKADQESSDTHFESCPPRLKSTHASFLGFLPGENQKDRQNRLAAYRAERRRRRAGKVQSHSSTHYPGIDYLIDTKKRDGCVDKDDVGRFVGDEGELSRSFVSTTDKICGSNVVSSCTCADHGHLVHVCQTHVSVEQKTSDLTAESLRECINCRERKEIDLNNLHRLSDSVDNVGHYCEHGGSQYDMENAVVVIPSDYTPTDEDVHSSSCSCSPHILRNKEDLMYFCTRPDRSKCSGQSPGYQKEKCIPNVHKRTRETMQYRGNEINPSQQSNEERHVITYAVMDAGHGTPVSEISVKLEEEEDNIDCDHTVFAIGKNVKVSADNFHFSNQAKLLHEKLSSEDGHLSSRERSKLKRDLARLIIKTSDDVADVEIPGNSLSVCKRKIRSESINIRKEVSKLQRQRESARDRTRRKRAVMTDTEKEAVRRRERERVRKKRAVMSESEKNVYRARERERARLKRALMSDEKREEERKKSRDRMREFRVSMSDEQKKLRRESSRVRMQMYRQRVYSDPKTADEVKKRNRERQRVNRLMKKVTEDVGRPGDCELSTGTLSPDDVFRTSRFVSTESGSDCAE